MTIRVYGPLRGSCVSAAGSSLVGATGLACDRSARRMRFEPGCREQTRRPVPGDGRWLWRGRPKKGQKSGSQVLRDKTPIMRKGGER